MVDSIKAYQQPVPANTQRVETGVRPDRRDDRGVDTAPGREARETDRAQSVERRDLTEKSDRERRDLLSSLGSERSGSAGKGAAQMRGSLLDVTA